MTTITINGVKWKVFAVDSNHERLVDEKGNQNAYGITLFRNSEIYIDGGLAPEVFKQVLVHELIHAIAFSYCTDINMIGEEEICDFIAAHFNEIKSLRKAVLKSI